MTRAWSPLATAACACDGRHTTSVRSTATASSRAVFANRRSAGSSDGVANGTHAIADPRTSAATCTRAQPPQRPLGNACAARGSVSQGTHALGESSSLQADFATQTALR